ncbi:type II secretion system F family protein [Candidatus Parcubacteria bacterium]|nr:type II secretion system F family protein [Candidatus Parcubacteria bacterium]
MPTFTYEAKTSAGQAKTGTVTAASTDDLSQTLRTEGYILVSAKAAVTADRESLTWFYRIQRVKLVDKIMFARNLGVMISAGLSITRALTVMAQQTDSRKLSWALERISESVNRGEPLSDGLAQHPAIFNELFVSMVRVGETAGNLEEVLKLIARQLQKEYDLASRVRGAMIYPAVVLSVMLIVGGVMMVVVVPKLVEVFQDLNVDLPITTRFIIAVSSFLQQFWYVVVALIAAAVFGLRWWRKTLAGKRLLDWFWLALPVVGPLIRKVNTARFARTFGSLLESGVSVVQSLEIVSRTLTNHYYRESLAAVGEAVVKGGAVSEALSREPDLYPPLITQMMNVGEETGSTTDILHRVAVFYETEVARTAKNLSTIVEPVLMVVIGAAVGFFAISMIQPMYSLVNAL